MLKRIKSICKNSFNGIYNRIVFLRQGVKTDGELLIRGRLYCKVGKTGILQFGRGCRINSAAWANVIGGDTRTAITVIGSARVVIGNNVGISNSAIVSRESVLIEDDVMIGGSCKIYDNDFHSINYEERISGFSGVKSSPIIIKKGAFIGAHTIVLKGVTIGEKSVIGAGSVVSKSVPDGEIWAGNPAQYIRKIED